MATELGRRLRELREKVGLSQQAVGTRLGLKARHSRGYVSRLEAGKAGDIRLSTIVRYLAACNEPVGGFFLHLDLDGVFRPAEELLALALDPESPEARRAASEARAREKRRIRKYARRALLKELRKEIAPIVQPGLVGPHASRMDAYVSAAEMLYKSGVKLMSHASGAPLTIVLKFEFDRIEGVNPDWFLDAKALHEVRLLIERKLGALVDRSNSTRSTGRT